ncbi:hypothetical protein OSTOST_23199 [Ostertagia ostertagi]
MLSLQARELLDASHSGMEDVKKRVLEFLAVRKLSDSVTGPILCFAGPPGIGKTSIAKAIAQSLGRNFERNLARWISADEKCIFVSSQGLTWQPCGTNYSNRPGRCPGKANNGPLYSALMKSIGCYTLSSRGLFDHVGCLPGGVGS